MPDIHPHPLLSAFAFAAIIINGQTPILKTADTELRAAIMQGRAQAVQSFVAIRLLEPQRFGCDNNELIASYLTAWGF